MTMKKTYQELKQELDDVMGALQQDSVDVDEAVKLYEQGQKLVSELEEYLEKTEATVKKVSKKA